MKLTLQDRLLRRELEGYSRYSSIKGLYGDRKWIDDLDIVNELGGHSGCVNALSWSKSGRLLASGSDDQHLNIHSYQPDQSTVPFVLTTTVATGHTANIFSVKFMPHSNDQTLVTCAGDGEVRIFDIEYSGRSTIPSAASNLASARHSGSGRRRRFHNEYQGVQYLSDGDTNCRVYRSHSDRVKRIVTESSPYLFLSCSEDGEVRQWDLRLPSSAYPSPRNRHDSSNVPPPLISYRRFQLDLNTISCSASQPHYIVLGGTHLHCFLHDRRMLGRDLGVERGSPGGTIPASDHEDELMSEATRCVRRFAPNGQKKMRRTDNGHVTACKISDANPNEMIASWSGDHIYSFDLVNSPDIREAMKEEEGSFMTGDSKGKVKETRNRKGKRRHRSSSTSVEWRQRGSSQPRQSGDVALRIRYENGQSEDIPIDVSNTASRHDLPGEAQEYRLSDPQKRSLKIAKSVMKIRKLLFSFEASSRGENINLSTHKHTFNHILYEAVWCIPEMDEIIRSWRYPVSPTAVDVAIQNNLRTHRDSARRFTQAAGTLARVLGGKLRTAGGDSPALHYFEEIRSSQNEANCDDNGQIFSYDFLKAILLWLEGGPEALLQGFKRPPNQRNANSRFPIHPEAPLSAISVDLIPYLLRLAQDRPIPNVDASRFDRDELRITYASEVHAVIAFSHAIKIPLEDLSRAIEPAPSSAEGAEASMARAAAQDRQAAIKHWAFKVGRGLLMNGTSTVNFLAVVDRAFGGSGTLRSGAEDEERMQEDVDPSDADVAVHSVSVVDRLADGMDNDVAMGNTEEIEEEIRDKGTPHTTPGTPSSTMEAHSESVILMDDLHNEIADHMADDTFDGEGGTESDHDGQESDNAGDSDGDITAEERQFMWQGASNRGKLRESVQSHVPCVSRTRCYRGHCNIKTVKDVNFFGLQDEYVVSGSDSGHVFIWDKKTSQLVNILEGDNEVVNVVQGHPYEPLLAVSGIDHTIKLFSPDSRAQLSARHGLNLGVSATGSHGHSSLFMSHPRRRRHPDSTSTTTEAGAGAQAEAEDGAQSHAEAGTNWDMEEVEEWRVREGGLPSRRRMHQSYQIISQNDSEREGGMRDAFITRSVLAQLAARLHARRGGDADGAGPQVGEDGFVVLDNDNCSVM